MVDSAPDLPTRESPSLIEAAGREGCLGFEEVFATEYRGLVRLATVVCGDPGAAEEVVQDAFTAALPRWDGIERHGAFLQRSVVNGAIDVTRRRRRTTGSEFGEHEGSVHDPQPADERLWAALDGLPDPQRAAVALRYYLDLPLAEVSAVLERPLNTVKSDLRRALATLAKEVPR
jgi:RNA polymerase sigma factor (sigma-70 family)